MTLDGSQMTIPFLAEGEEYDGKSVGFTGSVVL
jgi:hypothetical protein